VTHPSYTDIGKRFRQREDWTDAEPVRFPEHGADLYNLEFRSKNAHFLLGRDSYRCAEHGIVFPGEPAEPLPVDAEIAENLTFRYPLLRESGPLVRRDRVTIILHGLNERSYGKYVPWAYHLWKQTGAPVILFPMAFHINRVPSDWFRLVPESLSRRKTVEGNDLVHRFNAIMSERLESRPERFFWGALQTFWDVVDLAREIRAGRHAHVAPDARIDLLGYSAGGFVALALMLDDPERIFSESRAALFATAGAVRDLNLASPLIVDTSAETAMMKMYVRQLDQRFTPRMHHWIDHHSEARWLRTFCGLRPDRATLEARMRAIAPRVAGIANANDEVFPTGAMCNALQGVRRDTGVHVEELQLGIHENPFACPDLQQPERRLVLEMLDEQRYGNGFERFIEIVARHLTADR
jgi:pimeloyl-ACP methyl ester carboxylesterase